MGVHRFSAKSALMGDIGWTLCTVRRKVNMLRYWNRLIEMTNDRLTKHVFENDYRSVNHTKNWCYFLYKLMSDNGLEDVFLRKECCDLELCQARLVQKYETEWKTELRRKPKLRLYRNLKSSLGVEKYLQLNLPSNQRSILAQLRLGILPLCVETGRYINLKFDDRICKQCNDNVTEDEMHFIFECSLYQVERNNFLRVIRENEPETREMEKIDILLFCFQTQVRKLARYVQEIFEKRQQNMYKV